ncbi:MAG: HAD-IIIA family hydrolase [Cocleimonas sp.]|nr:HAD-IIIA family hydrolase [Cocleimonas sp.]
MGKYSLLVFDWDGTLLDSEAQIVNCMQSAIGELSLESRTNEQITSIIGLGLEKGVAQLYPKMDMKLVIKTAQTYREYHLYKDKTPTPLFDGAKEALIKLREVGYDLAIATNKSRRGLDKGLSETDLVDLFPITRTVDDTHPKPNPQMLEEILTDHNLEASKALMIGDSEYDLQLAKNTKVDGLAVSYGVHGLMRLLKQDPVGFIDKIGQLPDWLENHG